MNQVPLVRGGVLETLMLTTNWQEFDFISMIRVTYARVDVTHARTGRCYPCMAAGGGGGDDRRPSTLQAQSMTLGVGLGPNTL